MAKSIALRRQSSGRVVVPSHSSYPCWTIALAVASLHVVSIRG